MTRASLLLFGLALLLGGSVPAEGAPPTYVAEVMADAPRAYWRLNESPGATTAVDSSGNGNSGTYNAVELGVDGVLELGGDTAGNFPLGDPAPAKHALPPANDNFAVAREIVGGTGRTKGHNILGTKEAGEPNHAGNAGGRSIWFRWRAAASGSITIETTGSTRADGAALDTLLGVYTGSSVGALTTIVSNDNGSGSVTSKVTLAATANVNYYVAVDGKNGADGTINLLWKQGSSPPANDSFSQPVTIGGKSGWRHGTNVNATKEAGEPNHAGNPGGKSIWFQWVAPATGRVLFYTLGSSFNTLLGAYTGQTVQSLTLIAANDDGMWSQTSSAEFHAIQGNVYRIVVDGYRSSSGQVASGNVDLAWHSDPHIDVGDRFDFPGKAPFSLEAWVSEGSSGPIFTKFECVYDCTYSYGYALSIGERVGFSRYSGYESESVDASSTAKKGWTHVVATYDGATINLYLNGAKVASRTSMLSHADNSAHFMVGWTYGVGGETFVGAMDELAVYPVALSDARVAAHYAAAVPTVLEVTLNPLVATSQNPNTAAQATEWGAFVSSNIQGTSDWHRLRWHFNLGAGQSLRTLSNGGVAVVSESASSAATPPAEDDFDDALPIEPVDSNELTDEDVPAAGLPDRNDPPYLEDNDGADFDYGQPTDEGEAAMEAIGAAQDELEDEVVAVASAPRARDGAGNPVTATFTISGDSVDLIVEPSGSAVYPIRVDADLYEFLEEENPPPAGPAPASIAASPDCPIRPQIVTYNPNGWQPLLDAFKGNKTPCADYYIVIPGLAADKTRFRLTSPRIVDTVCAGDENTVGARFHPVAEFHWNDWKRFYVDQQVGGDIPRNWRKAGQEFRRRMAAAGGPGYGSNCAATGGDIFPRWAVNEFPDTPWLPDHSILPNSVQTNDLMRSKAIQLLIGLHDGPDGKRTGYRQARGIPFVISREHRETNFRGRSGPIGKCDTCWYASYRAGVRGLLLRRGWWNAIRPRVLFWSQETFTNCWKVCLPQVQDVPTRGRLVSNYIYHPLHFLDAGLREGTAAEKDTLRAAQLFFRGEATVAKPGRYSPLMTAFWHGAAYGETADFPPDRDLDIMKGHVSLQIFTRRRQTSGHPRPRLGFAWNRGAGSGTEELAQWVAARLKAAYSPGGTANDACIVVAGGTNWCRQSVPSSPPRTLANRCWPHNFRSWTNSTMNCR